MRVVLVGTPGERARLRTEVLKSGIEIAAEVETPAEAWRVADGADAILLAAPQARSAGAEWGIRGPRERPREGVRRDEVPRNEGEPLTARELEVLQLLAEGLPNKAIAGRLAISDQTVKAHLASIFGKVGASNRTDAVRRALRRGLIGL